MLNIQCAKCGAKLKGQETIVTPFFVYLDGIKYQDFKVACNKCGGLVNYERFAKKAAENKAKAMAKLARKQKKTIKQISEEEQYNIIMRKAGKRAKEIATARGVSPVRLQDFNAAIDELPQEEKDMVLAYEDKVNMALFKSGTNKPTKHIKPNSILLLTQGIIEHAIAEKDEDFFKSEYGAQIVDTYNTTLTMHTSYDYGITADLLLDKMRKDAIKVKGEDDDE
jgi:hypothetical protein